MKLTQRFLWYWWIFPDTTFYFIASVIIGWCTVKIYSNLLTCRGKGCMTCIAFSRRHNWIIRPSTSRLMYAFLCTLVLTIAYILYCALFLTTYYYIDMSTMLYSKLELVPDLMILFGHTMYFFYMVSSLEEQMDHEPLIECMVSTKLIFVMKVLTVTSFVLVAVTHYLYIASGFQYEYHGIPFAMISDIFVLCSRVSIEAGLLYLYYSGLNNVCRYWYSQRRNEYEQHGTTDKVHEILITITCSTVIVIASFAATLLFFVYGVLEQYVLFKLYTGSLNWVYMISDSFWSLFRSIDDITYGLTVYFMFPFGYAHYRALCGKCHDALYRKFERKHHQNVDHNRAKSQSCYPGWSKQDNSGEQTLLAVNHQ